MVSKNKSRSRFCHTIRAIGAAQPWHTARLDFFGSVLLVCAIGVIAKVVQTLLAN
jgi:hypothetical protein